VGFNAVTNDTGLSSFV